MESKVNSPDIKTLQADGKGPAPCARFCEATAFRIEIAGWKRDQAENLKNQCKLVDQNTELTAERDALRVELNEESQRLVSFILGDHAKVCTERDALQQAAKLARDALQRLYKDFPYLNQANGGIQTRETIEALKKAGV